MGELSGWTMRRIVPQTLADQDQGSAVEVAEEATTNHMAAVEDKPAALQAMAEVHMVQVEAGMAAGMAAMEVDKEAHHMVEDNHTVEVEANKAVVVVVAMVSNNNTKVNKVAILDNPTLSWRNRGNRMQRYFEIPN
jgi:hypothetical protein